MKFKLNNYIDRKKFNKEYYEKKPGLFRDALSLPAAKQVWKIVDAALDSHNPKREMFKLINLKRIDPASYLDEYVDIGITRTHARRRDIYRHMSEGATLVLNRVDISSHPLNNLCLQVGRFLGLQTTCNLYACMGGGPATDVHWDTHDVFVLQLSGEKHWSLYEPTFLFPINGQDSTFQKEKLPIKVFESITLKAGDALYVPRGWWHKVMPIDSKETVHLTIAIHAPLILDYLVWACGNILPNSVSFRRSIIDLCTGQKDAENALRELTELLGDNKMLEKFISKSRKRERTLNPFNLSNILHENNSLIDSSTLVRISSRTAAGSIESHFPESSGFLNRPLDSDILEYLIGKNHVTAHQISKSFFNDDFAQATKTIQKLALLDYVQLEIFDEM